MIQPAPRYNIDDPAQVIRQVQTYLLEVAYDDPRVPKIAIDGIYDDATRNAVSAFQKIAGLPETGIVDFITWTVLYEYALRAAKKHEESIFLDEGAFDIRLGDLGHPVIVLQSLLGEFSKLYPNVPRPAVTGQFGLTTADAVRAMQRNYGEYADGLVTIALWNRMLRDYRANKRLESQGE